MRRAVFGELWQGSNSGKLATAVKLEVWLACQFPLGSVEIAG